MWALLSHWSVHHVTGRITMYCNRSFLIVSVQFPFFKNIFTCIGKGAAIIYKVVHFRRALAIALINKLTSVFMYAGIPAASFLVVGDCILTLSCTFLTRAVWNRDTTTLSYRWLGALTINTSGHIKPLCSKPFSLYKIPIFSFNTLIYHTIIYLHTTYLLQKIHHTGDIPVELWTVVYLSFIVFLSSLVIWTQKMLIYILDYRENEI